MDDNVEQRLAEEAEMVRQTREMLEVELDEITPEVERLVELICQYRWERGERTGLTRKWLYTEWVETSKGELVIEDAITDPDLVREAIFQLEGWLSGSA